MDAVNTAVSNVTKSFSQALGGLFGGSKPATPSNGSYYGDIPSQKPTQPTSVTNPKSQNVPTKAEIEKLQNAIVPQGPSQPPIGAKNPRDLSLNGPSTETGSVVDSLRKGVKAPYAADALIRSVPNIQVKKDVDLLRVDQQTIMQVYDAARITGQEITITAGFAKDGHVSHDDVVEGGKYVNNADTGTAIDIKLKGVTDSNVKEKTEDFVKTLSALGADNIGVYNEPGKLHVDNADRPYQPKPGDDPTKWGWSSVGTSRWTATGWRKDVIEGHVKGDFAGYRGISSTNIPAPAVVGNGTTPTQTAGNNTPQPAGDTVTTGSINKPAQQPQTTAPDSQTPGTAPSTGVFGFISNGVTNTFNTAKDKYAQVKDKIELYNKLPAPVQSILKFFASGSGGANNSTHHSGGGGDTTSKSPFPEATRTEPLVNISTLFMRNNVGVQSSMPIVMGDGNQYTIRTRSVFMDNRMYDIEVMVNDAGVPIYFGMIIDDGTLYTEYYDAGANGTLDSLTVDGVDRTVDATSRARYFLELRNLTDFIKKKR
jgi:uncharacterized protein YcbK (DUF882 family)